MVPGLRAANRRLRWRLVAVALGMFGFGFALVPLYDVFCQVTGRNGKPGRVAAAAAAEGVVDPGRRVNLELLASVNGELPWEFRPQLKSLSVRPGESATVEFYVHNRSGRTMVGQAVPSVSPGAAARYLSKTECFCFTQQTLAPGEERAMPVRLVLSPQLPAQFGTVTLSYTFFDTEAGRPGAGPGR